MVRSRVYRCLVFLLLASIGCEEFNRPPVAVIKYSGVERVWDDEVIVIQHKSYDPDDNELEDPNFYLAASPGYVSASHFSKLGDEVEYHIYPEGHMGWYMVTLRISDEYGAEGKDELCFYF